MALFLLGYDPKDDFGNIFAEIGNIFVTKVCVCGKKAVILQRFWNNMSPKTQNDSKNKQ